MTNCGCGCGATSRDEVQKEYSEVAKRVACGETLGAAETNHSGQSDERCVYNAEDTAAVPEKSLCSCRGCANPFNKAELTEGMKVLDLGSGGGTDCFIAAKKVGESGHVTGLDMTQEMIDIANSSKEEAGVDNVDFVKGFLEELPFEDGSFDYILSNCVINLCTDKTKVLEEAYRVLKSGGKMVATDMVIDHSDKTTEEVLGVGKILGCTSGVLRKDDYIKTLETIGFKDIEIEPFEEHCACSLHEKAKEKGLEAELEGFKDSEIDKIFVSSYVMAQKA